MEHKHLKLPQNLLFSKARELLGYDPEWSFERGIQAAIEWYKENLDIGDEGL